MGSKLIFDVADVSDVVPYHQWHIWRHDDMSRELYFLLGSEDDDRLAELGEVMDHAGAEDDYRLAELGEVADHAGELSSGHLDHAGVVQLWNAKVLLVKVHQLHLIGGHLLLVGRLEHECDGDSLVLAFDTWR